jgi:hypothetical protein
VKERIMKRASLLLVALALGGCSRGLDGFYQQVHFDSAPAGATVNVAIVDGKQRVEVPVDGRCTTPCVLPIARDRNYVAVFSLSGCSPSEIPLIPTRMKFWFAPALPDSITGNAYDLTPDPLRAQLSCGTTS